MRQVVKLLTIHVHFATIQALKRTKDLRFQRPLAYVVEHNCHAMCSSSLPCIITAFFNVLLQLFLSIELFLGVGWFDITSKNIFINFYIDFDYKKYLMKGMMTFIFSWYCWKIFMVLTFFSQSLLIIMVLKPWSYGSCLCL